MKKRITALLLCLVMMFSLIPTSVWATDPPATDAGSGGIEEQDPSALTKEKVKEILQESNALVAVKCINPNGGCNVNPVKYGLAASTFTMEKNEENGYTLTVEAAPFVAAYSNSGQGRGLPHDLYSAKTLIWKLSRENDAWTAKPAVAGVDDTVLVTHMPEATYDVLKGMQGVIKTRCVNNTTAYTEYGVIAGVVGESAQITKGEVSGTYNLTISTKNFADAASKHNDRDHDLLTGETANFVLSLSKNDTTGKYVWTATPVTPGVDNVCEVAHRVKVTFDQNYTNAPAATEVYCKYNKAVGEDAFPADPSRSGYVFQGWNTNADGTGDAFSNATAVTEDVTVYAQWGQLHPVQLVIYRNGDTSKAYKTVSLDPQLKGTVIDLNDVDIGDYYTANNTGKYDFYGWYNDGKWNEYTRDLANPPAGLEKITVNGWTNLKCMVYDYETVAYFETAEALKAYQTDHTGGPLFTTTARKGSTLPTVDAPEATRAGYTFQYWSREGQSVNVTGQTVNGWTNLYGNWEINTYNIAATLYMNGADSSVQETGKTYAWSHRYGGEYGKPIDYTDMFAALKAKALEVDAANEPYDAEIKLCFPKSEELFNEKILTYGQDGAFWNPGVKNTAYIWGYATTSYEVIFNSDGGSAVDTQIVKYGEKAVSETPEKYGYNFLGWYDADGKLFDFNTKITHKTELTAQWAKKDYVIASDLRINGDVANLADGKTYAWTHRYGGKFEETIDYQPMLDALKARAMKVDAANGPVDSVVTLCFPGSDKLFNEAVKTYGQDTANWQAANNTAYIWGYATNVYAVTFNYGTEDIKNEILKVNFGDTITKSEPKRDGYKFTGWYDENGNLFSFETPITKSMTLTAGWEIIPHDIYAYARLNSSFGQLTTSEFGEDIKLNAETLKNLGLEIGYNANGYISIGKFTFNAMALTDDLYFDDETTPAVLEALKKDIVLETGVSADTAAKIAWTYLYQADDSKGSDYMYKSGYPTTDKDSYQLSGNLFLAAAMFDAGDVGEDEVKGMPAVNYTFDDVFAIHDFYLPGTEIELPALERTGYTFLGWEVKVIPSDDVANYADADAEKTLVEAGKYTITEGGAIFTAQWKINTYNVTFDSNGGSAVESQQVDYRAKVTKPAEPTREGYHFMGWFNGDKEWNFDEDTMGAGDMTLTAKWEINEYTVSFDSKGGTKVDSQIVKHGDTADKPSNPRRNGYVFKGWYLDGQKFDFSTPITGDITLTARWATKTSGGSNSSSDTTTKDNGKTVKSGKTFDGGIALYVGLSVLSATGSALVITKKKRG